MNDVANPGLETNNAELNPPSVFKMALEGRAIFEAGSLAMGFPILQASARGDGHPVLVLPGFLAGDFSTKLLRLFLKSRNYVPYGWGLGRNMGQQSHPKTGCSEEVVTKLEQIYHKHGEKVSVIGWSLGGIYARELARMQPEKIRSVISLGSPFSSDLKANRAMRVFEKTSGFSLDDIDESLRSRMRIAPPVPATSIYSRSDGITAWQCCLEIPDESTENIEVSSSHCGLGHHPFVMWVIADRLAQAEGEWKLFEPKFLERLMFK
ncbi:MAG: alpha/beta hydrolase [Proteobacteria bacterium]|nr:alpha/beta hydrolase [Pseudomonadota bacterium]